MKDGFLLLSSFVLFVSLSLLFRRFSIDIFLSFLFFHVEEENN